MLTLQRNPALLPDLVGESLASLDRPLCEAARFEGSGTSLAQMSLALQSSITLSHLGHEMLVALTGVGSGKRAEARGGQHGQGDDGAVD